MKKIVSILLIGILLSSCNKEEKKNTSYVINGNAKGVYNGIRVYLKSAKERGAKTSRDTAIVMNEAFKFEGTVEYPQMWFLTVDNVSGSIPVLMENETIDVIVDKNDITASKISGTKSNEALLEHSIGYKKLADIRNNFKKEYRSQMKSPDSNIRAKYSADFADINDKISKFSFQFLNTHNDNYFSLALIEDILKTNPNEFLKIDKAYNHLEADIKNSVYGQIVDEKINIIKQKNEALASLNIGKVAPDFSAPSPEGKQISLNDIKGKVTIIDFWASWCGPCRRENPNVVKVYNKYHDKGLEIISVSLDKPGQKEKWLKAIADDKLTWHHVSNLNYFKDPVAQLYNIQSIPATYILDAEGKIVAKSLRGQALEDKIAEMLN